MSDSDAREIEAEAGAETEAPKRSIATEMLTILLAFERFGPEELARAFGCSEAEIEELDHDPETRKMRAALKRVLPGHRDVARILQDDTDANFRWLRNLRRGFIDGRRATSEDAKIIRERRAAAQFIGERQVAKKVPPAEVSITRGRDDVIDVTTEDEARIARVMGLLDAPEKEKEKATTKEPSDD